MAKWTHTHMPQQREIVKSPLFCTRAEKVTVWMHALKKRMLCVACWLHLSGAWEGFPLDRKRKKRKKAFLATHGKAELWRAAHTCFSEGACFTCSPNDQHAGFSLHCQSQPVSKERERRGWHTCPSQRGWMNYSSNNGAQVTEVLSVC